MLTIAVLGLSHQVRRTQSVAWREHSLCCWRQLWILFWTSFYTPLLVLIHSLFLTHPQQLDKIREEMTWNQTALGLNLCIIGCVSFLESCLLFSILLLPICRPEVKLHGPIEMVSWHGEKHRAGTWPCVSVVPQFSQRSQGVSLCLLPDSWLLSLYRPISQMLFCFHLWLALPMHTATYKFQMLREKALIWDEWGDNVC